MSLLSQSNTLLIDGLYASQVMDSYGREVWQRGLYGGTQLDPFALNSVKNFGGYRVVSSGYFQLPNSGICFVNSGDILIKSRQTNFSGPPKDSPVIWRTRAYLLAGSLNSPTFLGETCSFCDIDCVTEYLVPNSGYIVFSGESGSAGGETGVFDSGVIIIQSGSNVDIYKPLPIDNNVISINDIVNNLNSGNQVHISISGGVIITGSNNDLDGLSGLSPLTGQVIHPGTLIGTGASGQVTINYPLGPTTPQPPLPTGIIGPSWDDIILPPPPPPPPIPPREVPEGPAETPDRAAYCSTSGPDKPGIIRWKYSSFNGGIWYKDEGQCYYEVTQIGCAGFNGGYWTEVRPDSSAAPGPGEFEPGDAWYACTECQDPCPDDACADYIQLNDIENTELNNDQQKKIEELIQFL